MIATSLYLDQLCCKLSKLYDFVETHMTEASHHQQTSYNQHVQERSFHVGDTVWLALPTAGPKWEEDGQSKQCKVQQHM